MKTAEHGCLELILRLEADDVPLHELRDIFDYVENAERTLEDRASLIIDLKTAAERRLSRMIR